MKLNKGFTVYLPSINKIENFILEFWNKDSSFGSQGTKGQRLYKQIPNTTIKGDMKAPHKSRKAWS